MLALKIHPSPLRHCKSFVHCSGRSWDIMRYTHGFIGCSRVPDDLFQDKIPESLPKGGKCDNKLEWYKVWEAPVLKRTGVVHIYVCLMHNKNLPMEQPPLHNFLRSCLHLSVSSFFYGHQRCCCSIFTQWLVLPVRLHWLIQISF